MTVLIIHAIFRICLIGVMKYKVNIYERVKN